MVSDVAYVLIPGGGMSDWVWRDLDGPFTNSAVRVAGRLSQNSRDTRRSATIMDCVQHVTDAMEAAAVRRFILVAHSGGGILAPLVAQQIGDRILGIVFVAANIPQSHKNALSSLPWTLRIMNMAAARIQVRSTSTPMSKYERTVRTRFCNDADEEAIQYVLRQDLLSEPLCVFTERLSWDGLPRIPMAYVVLTHDKTATTELQRRMASHLSIERMLEVEGDHMVMLSHPDRFNDALRRAAAPMVGAT